MATVAEQPTATWRIWNDRFQCKISKIHLHDSDEISVRGMFTFGDSHRDREMVNERILTYLSINEMVDKHRDGIPIAIPKKKDAIRIYELVSQHMLIWIDYLKWSGLYNAPFEDLLAMDAFVCELHAQVKFDLESSLDKTVFSQRVNTITAFSRNGLAARQNANPGRILTDEEIEQIFPKRDTMMYVIKQFMVESNRYGN